MTTLVEIDPALNSLIDRVIQGEEIILTRRGEPVAELVPSKPKFDGDWFRARRIRPNQPFDAAAAVRAMRDRED